MSDAFPDPFARAFQFPGGPLLDAVGKAVLYEASQRGLTSAPFYTGGANAFDAIRGHSYDARQLAAINAAAERDRNAMLSAVPGITAFFGKETTDEWMSSLSKTSGQLLPLAATLAASSPEARQALSVFSGGVSETNLALGVEGLTRQTYDPVRGSYGLSTGAADAMTMSLAGMLRAPGDMTADPSMTRGVPLNGGLSYGFDDIQTINLMASVQRQGGGPSMSSVLNMAASSSLDAALKSGDVTPRDLLLSGTDQSAMRAMLLNDKMASEEDFYNPQMSGLLALRAAGVAGPDGANKLIADEKQRTDTLQRIKNDPASFNMSDDELNKMRQELESAGTNADLLNQINADRYASVAQDRLRAVKAVHGFLSAKEIDELGEDVMSMSNEMLQQFSGGAAQQMSGEKLSQNIRELKFSGDRLGLDRDQRLAIANVSAQMAQQQGFVAAAGFSYQQQYMEAMQAYSDAGIGSYAALGYDAYGTPTMQQQTQREVAALGGIRNSRNAKLTAAASILAKREGVTVTEGGAMDVFLRDAIAGQFGSESEGLLSQDTESIIDTLLASSSGLSREEIYEVMQNDFVVAREMDNNRGVLDANKRLAGSEALRQGLGQVMTRQIGDIVRGTGGSVADNSALSAALGDAMISQLEGMDPEEIASQRTGEDGILDATQSGNMIAVIRQQAASGNTAAQKILADNPTEEKLGQYVRNMATRSYAAAEGELQMPLSNAVASYGVYGQNNRETARARSEAMAILSDFADSDNPSLAQAAFRLLESADVEGGNLLDLISKAGVDITSDTQDEIVRLEQQAAMAQAAYETELANLPAGAEGAKAIAERRAQAFEGLGQRIGGFIDKPLKEAQQRIDEENNAKKPKDLTEPASAAAGAAGAAASIASATIDTVQMSNVTITVGDSTIVTGGTASAAPRTSRTTV